MNLLYLCRMSGLPWRQLQVSNSVVPLLESVLSLGTRPAVLYFVCLFCRNVGLWWEWYSIQKKIEFASHRNCLYPDSCSIVVSHIIFAYPSSESNTSSTRSSVCIVSCSAPKGLACVNDLSFGWSGVCLCTLAMWFGVWCTCLHAFPAADALAAWEISWLSVLLV